MNREQLIRNTVEAVPESAPHLTCAEFRHFLSHRTAMSKKAYTPQGLETLARRARHMDLEDWQYLCEYAVSANWQGLPPALLPSTTGAPARDAIPGMRSNQDRLKEMLRRGRS